MINGFRRGMSLLLAMVTVISLLPAMGVLMEAEAAELLPHPGYMGFAQTEDDVATIVNDYFSVVTKNETVNAFWNRGVRGELSDSVLKPLGKKYNKDYGVPKNSGSGAAVLKKLPYIEAVTNKSCKGGNHDWNDDLGLKSNCTSNFFRIGDNTVQIDKWEQAQCEGFAEYMAYVVFGDRIYEYSDPIYNSASKGIEIRPGDVVRKDGHSIFVYDIFTYNGIKYAKTIECNTSSADGYCLIYKKDDPNTTAFTRRARTVDSLASKGSNYICKAPVEQTSWSTNVEVKLKDKCNVYPEPVMGETTLTASPLPKGTLGIATEIQKNDSDNYWYKISFDNVTGWIHGSHCEVVGLAPGAITVSDYTKESALGRCEKGKTKLDFTEDLAANGCTMTKVTGALYSADGGKAKQSFSATGSFTSFDVKTGDDGVGKKSTNGKINLGLKPRNLAVGLYKYTIHVDAKVKVTDGTSISEKSYTDQQVHEYWFEVYSGSTKAALNIKFNANGGSCGQLNKRIKADATIGELPVPTRNGYAFQGWYTAQTGGSKITEKSTFSKNTTLYAQWKKPDANSFTVSFDANGGTGAPEAQEKQKNKDLTLSKTEPTRKGYTFEKWSDGKTTYKPGETYKKNEDVMLVAQWKPIEYSICYLHNGGSGTMSATAAVYDKEATLSKNKFTRSGYEFVGWNTKDDGSGTMYQPGDKVKNLVEKKGVDRILYAIWKKTGDSAQSQSAAEQYLAKCTAYFSAGTLEITSASAWFKALPCSESTNKASTNVYGSAVPKGTQMTVMGLYKNSEGNYWYKATWNGKTGYIYASQASFTAAAADFTIANPRKPETLNKGAGFSIRGTVTSNIGFPYKITGTISDCNGQQDSHTVTSNSKSYDLAAREFDNNISFGLLAAGDCKYTVKAYVTCHYSTDGTKLLKKDLSKTLIDHSFQVVGAHTLTFVSGDGQNKTVKTLSVKDKATFTIPDIGYQREGYEFLGYTVKRLKDGKIYGGGKWQTEKELANSGKDAQIYVVGRKLTLDNSWTTGGVTDSNYQFTGLWEALPTYTVTYNANGGSGAPAAQTTTTDKTLTLSSTMPTRTGYTFQGWAKSSTATNADFAKGASYTAKQSITLYAVWKINTYTVSYNANGGSGAPAAQTKAYGQQLKLSTTEPVRAGYTFLGWAESETATNAAYQKGGSFTKNQNVTLYAVWKADKTGAYLADNLGDTTWVLENDEAVEAKNADTANLSRVKVTFTMSEKMAQKYPDAEDWARNNPVYVTEHEIPLQMQNLALDFLVSDGQYDLVIRSRDSYIAQYTCPIQVSGDTEIRMDLYELIVNFNGGKLQVGNAEVEQTTSYFIYENYESFAWAFGRLPSREGHTLVGWDPDPDALVPEYDANFYEHLFFDRDLELYAIWKADTTGQDSFTLTYYSALSAANLPEAQTVQRGETVTLSNQIPTSDGYAFEGWGINVDGDTIVYQPGETITIAEDTILQALWSRLPIYLYDVNDGTYWEISRKTGQRTEIPAFETDTLCHVTITLNPSQEILQTYGSAQAWFEGNMLGTLGLPQFDIPVVFENEKIDVYISSGIRLISIGNINMSHTITTSSQIAVDVQEVRIDSQGGVIEGTDSGTDSWWWVFSTNYPRTDICAFDISLVKEGYTLIGWARSADAVAPDLDVDCTFADLLATDTKLYAVWEQNDPVLSYTSDRTAGNIPAAQTIEKGQSVTLSNTIPVCEGFVFQGWSANIDGNNVTFQPGETVTFEASVTLSAIWEMAPIQVYDVNADKYWQINPSSYAVTVVPSLDTTNLAHITITLNPSEAIQNSHVNIQDWYNDYDFSIGPMGPGDGYFQISGNKFDFYVTKGTYYCRNGANGANSFNFQSSTDITFHIYQLTMDASYDDCINVSQTYFIGNYPYSGAMASYPERDGYTLVGWSTDPDAVTAEYPIEFPWAFNADTTVYAVWEANS